MTTLAGSHCKWGSRPRCKWGSRPRPPLLPAGCAWGWFWVFLDWVWAHGGGGGVVFKNER